MKPFPGKTLIEFDIELDKSEDEDGMKPVLTQGLSGFDNKINESEPGDEISDFDTEFEKTELNANEYCAIKTEKQNITPAKKVLPNECFLTNDSQYKFIITKHVQQCVSIVVKDAKRRIYGIAHLLPSIYLDILKSEDGYLERPTLNRFTQNLATYIGSLDGDIEDTAIEVYGGHDQYASRYLQCNIPQEYWAQNLVRTSLLQYGFQDTNINLYHKYSYNNDRMLHIILDVSSPLQQKTKIFERSLKLNWLNTKGNKKDDYRQYIKKKNIDVKNSSPTFATRNNYCYNVLKPSMTNKVTLPLNGKGTKYCIYASREANTPEKFKVKFTINMQQKNTSNKEELKFSLLQI